MSLKRQSMECFRVSILTGMFLLYLFSSLVYASPEERDEIKRAIRLKEAQWVAEETSVSRLHPEERRQRLGLLEHFPLQDGYIVSSSDNSFSSVSAVSAVSTAPASFDWRNFNGYNYVTPVKDQGNCGSCWAFATTAALESQVIMTKGFATNLSEQILISCGGAGSCSGGYLNLASDYIQHTGLPLESYYPYTAKNGLCTNAAQGWQSNVYQIKSWSWLSPAINVIKEALYSYGPLVTTMDVYSDFFYYSSGIYHHTSGAYQGGHAILLIGFDDGNQYFVAKNSWGTSWGESGYFRISYSEVSSAVRFGTYTIAYFPFLQTNSAPTLGTLTPSSITSATGSPQTFTAVYSDPDGFANLSTVDFLIGPSSGINAIWLRYDRTANKISLYNDAGNASVGSCTPATTGTLGNSQGTVDCSKTVVSSSGNNLAVNWSVTPKAAFASSTPKNIWEIARDYSNATSGWINKGSWTVLNPNKPPTLGTLNPSSVTSAAGSPQTFTAVYSDPDGFANLLTVDFLIGPSSGIKAIWLRYDRSTNKISLYNDTGNAFVGSCTPATTGTLGNSQGTLDCSKTIVSFSGNNLTVNWRVTPKAAFASSTPKNILEIARDYANATSGWYIKGAWRINQY
jgi:C1A family cysteine protease